MATESKLKEVVLKAIGEEEDVDSLKRNLTLIEIEINDLAEGENAKLSDVLKRARILLERKSSEVFISKIWSKIESGLKQTIKL